jgi:acetyl-CoA synthetase
MGTAAIHKSLEQLTVQPNMLDYRKTCDSFSWQAIRDELAGLPDGGLNIAVDAVDRHAAGPRAEQLALRWLSKEGKTRDFTFRDLRAETNRFADVLAALGIQRESAYLSLPDASPSSTSQRSGR